MWHFHYVYQQVSQGLWGILASIWKRDFSSIVILLVVYLVIKGQAARYVFVWEMLGFQRKSYIMFLALRLGQRDLFFTSNTGSKLLSVNWLLLGNTKGSSPTTLQTRSNVLLHSRVKIIQWNSTICREGLAPDPFHWQHKPVSQIIRK